MYKQDITNQNINTLYVTVYYFKSCTVSYIVYSHKSNVIKEA